MEKFSHMFIKAKKKCWIIELINIMFFFFFCDFKTK